MGGVARCSSSFAQLERTGALEQSHRSDEVAPVTKTNWRRLEHWSAMDASEARACLLQSSPPAPSSSLPPFRGVGTGATGANWRGRHPGMGGLAETEGRAELERGSRPQQSGGSAPVQTDRQAVPLPPGLGTVPASRPLRAGTTPNGVQSDTSETWVVGVDVVDGEVVGHG
jgi:hypothetical protein